MWNLSLHPVNSPYRNLTKGDMSKIQTKKLVFFFSSSKINKYYFIIFLRRPILDPKIPLMINQEDGRSQSTKKTRLNNLSSLSQPHDSYTRFYHNQILAVLDSQTTKSDLN